MAYLLDPNLDEDKNQNAQQNISGGQAGIITGSPAQQAAGAQAGPDNKPTRSGSWSNLMSYINANAGNDAALGDRVKGNVDAEAQKAQEAQGQYQKAADSAISQGSVKDNGVTSSIKSDPTQVKKEDFDRQYNASYGGPNSATNINEYAQAYNQAQNVQNSAKLATGDQNDRVALLDKSFARPNYSQGERQLDSFILGGGQQGQERLQQIGQEYGNYGQQFQGLVDSTNNNIARAKAETDATRTATHTAADETKARFESALGDAQKIADQKNAAAQAQYQQAAKGNSDQLRNFGYDDNLQRFLSDRNFDFSRGVQNSGDYGIGDVANAKDISGYKALMGLLGSDPTIDTAAHGGASVGANAAALEAARKYQALDAELKQRMGAMDSANPGRDAMINLGLHDLQHSGINANLLSDIEALGGLANVVPARNVGDLINSGGNAGYGDVLRGSEGNDLATYASLLGLATPQLNRNYKQSTWNEAALRQAVEQKRADNAKDAERQRVQAEMDRLAAQRRREAEAAAERDRLSRVAAGDQKNQGFSSQQAYDDYFSGRG